MFLNAVVLILQEILEAALLLGMLLVLAGVLRRYWGQPLLLERHWVMMTLILGLVGAWLYAAWMPTISDWFDYVGQEVSNSFIHLLISIGILLLAYLPALGSRPTGLRVRGRLALASMVTIVVLSMLREGSEIILYLQGLISQPENFTPALFGGIVGVGIGVSCGTLLYYGLASLNSVWRLRTCVVIMALVCGNMASQIVVLLTQADWLPYTPEAWDSSALISENSLSGQLLFTLLGYEATPSVLQVVCYLLGIAAMVPSPLARIAWLQGERFDNRAAISRI